MTRRGFTYVEMSIVVVLLALLATALVVRMTAVRAGEDWRSFKMKFEALTRRVREHAIETASTLTLRYEDADRRIVAELGEGDTRNWFVELPEAVDATRFVHRFADTAGSEWIAEFYGDGSATPSGIEFDTGYGGVESIEIDPNRGLGKFVAGALPDRTAERWQAGELEQRVGP
ncbi:MAG: prepilin-type N-terminal cleavage/methylation domain-containing protein [Fimbriimonadaceae bacterium]|uniref:Prepilin-type N-terminal cleavage/methylation domain-containing protein n=1 Tax=Candidatus Nitrosymbiomonas proteolyticus TaxID=2608984 RepID=A0A809R4J4_9BACT|nr:MAG: prepilin-type N-terminal cleavage/methylation domain-containing protein [Fimbriimonadaceae bacterium]BBO22510.1 conserved hypothetical protein [Candidatus Nitrosymbiomonas proteolyticus]HQU19757.1 prepilin-type N-terminal cleavage/methylation domain-containing protein [Fimbriimonadaceae bacterium]